MSLIYSAINALERKQGQETAQTLSEPVRSAQEGGAGPSRFLLAAGILTLGAVALGAVAFALVQFRALMAPPAHVAPAANPADAVVAAAEPIPQPAPEIVQVPPPTQRRSAIPVAPAAPPPAQPADEPDTLVWHKAAPATGAPVAVAAAPVAKPVPTAIRNTPPGLQQKATAVASQDALLPDSVVVHPASEAKTGPAAASADQIGTLVDGATQAINSGDKARADALLAQLNAALPPDSLTLLRLRAWQNMKFGNHDLARQLYSSIVSRLPNDETSSINLAVLDWEAGYRDEARAILSRLAERHPDSPLVLRYSEEFRGQ